MSKAGHLFPFLSAEQSAAVVKRLQEYRGYAPTASDAVGALVLGQVYGWRGIMMLHSRSTVRKFEQVLGLSLRDCMPDRTQFSERILGVRIADEMGKFWAVVKGEVPVAGGKAYIDDAGQTDMFNTG